MPISAYDLHRILDNETSIDSLGEYLSSACAKRSKDSFHIALRYTEGTYFWTYTSNDNHISYGASCTVHRPPNSYTQLRIRDILSLEETTENILYTCHAAGFWYALTNKYDRDWIEDYIIKNILQDMPDEELLAITVLIPEATKGLPWNNEIQRRQLT